MSDSQVDLERDIAIGIARAEAEVCAAESCVAMVESRVRALAGTIAGLRALALHGDLIQADPIVAASPPAPIDDLTRERARRMLARGGFVRTS